MRHKTTDSHARSAVKDVVSVAVHWCAEREFELLADKQIRNLGSRSHFISLAYSDAAFTITHPGVAGESKGRR